jgi:Uma2 family endonuclease
MTPPAGATASALTPPAENVAVPERPSAPGERRWEIPPELVPRVDDIVIEDDTPVDNVFSEKNMRLLAEPLYSSWPGPGEGRPFLVLANVGLFHTWKAPPIVPDVMLSVDARLGTDPRQKENNTYFVWIIGKLPDVTLELVSNREGGEDTSKMQEYERLRIPYYVIFDPGDLLKGGVLRIYELKGLKYQPLDETWLEGVGLGLTLWDGTFEEWSTTWLRWCDRAGQVIPTGAEGREQERQRAENERQRAEDEHQRAENERQRADLAVQELERLREKLRQMGIEPSP